MVRINMGKDIDVRLVSGCRIVIPIRNIIRVDQQNNLDHCKIYTSHDKSGWLVDECFKDVIKVVGEHND